MKYIQVYMVLLAGLFLLNGCGGDCDDYTFGVEPCKKGENCVEIQIPDIPSLAKKDECIISNDSVYAEYGYDPAKNWPTIDFEKSTLVVKKVKYPGHSIGTSYKCIIINNVYTCYITSIYTGNKDILNVQYCWLLIPAKVDSSQVKFEVKKIKCRK